MTTTAASSSSAERRDALAEQLFQSLIGAQDTLHVYVGDRLGLYRALAEADSLNSQELAERAGIAERYAREWLEQQAASGYVDVAKGSDDGLARRYRLPPGGAEVLNDPDSLYFLAPITQLVVSMAQTLPQVMDAFRTGEGVPYEAYGADMRQGIERGNRPMFINQLAAEWIPAIPDVEARLRDESRPAQVADLGCGSGWSTIALAQGFPAARVDGIDLDAASIETARTHAAAVGLSGRIDFACRDAADPSLRGRYDLVTMFETLHDMSRPIDTLRSAREMLAPGGVVLIGDEGVDETFEAPAGDVDRFNYGWSALHCLPVGLIGPDPAGTGTVIRPDTVRAYAQQAGFSSVTELPIEHDLWRFYRLDP